MEKLSQWTGAAKNEWQPIGETTAKLPPGIYNIAVSVTMFGDFTTLSGIEISTDKLIEVDDGISAHMLASIRQFKSSADRYREFGLLHKRGFLLHGLPGTGKTVSIMCVARKVVDDGGIVLLIRPHLPIQAVIPVMRSIREVHPDLFILNVMEDLETHNDDHNHLLGLLDGEYQINNIVHVATTNHIEYLDPTLTNRPSRFDEVIEVGAPSEKARRAYFLASLPEGYHGKVDELVQASDGLMMAHLRELLACSVIMEQPLASVASRLKNMHKPIVPGVQVVQVNSSAKTSNRPARAR